MRVSTILVVGAESPARRTLDAALLGEGYAVHTATTAAEALGRAASVLPDVVVLIEPLPDQATPDLCRRLRQVVHRPLAIIVLLAQQDAGRRLAILEAGADDVLGQPCEPEELRARVRARLRRLGSESRGETPTPLQLDPQRYTATLYGHAVHLTRREFELFAALARAAGQLVPRATLVREVWGDAHPPGANVLEVYIRRLRRKLAAAGYPAAIRTRWRAGYRLDLLPPQADRAP